jgi:hypothetical protein
MPIPLTPSVRDKSLSSLLGAVCIGYMVGAYSVMGKGGAQAIANMAGEYMGREIVAFAQSRGQTLDTIPALIEFLQTNNLADAIEIDTSPTKFTAQISQCGICPKRVGKYKFDGTACPWGGILIRALGTILSREFSISVRLTPAESCTIALTLKPAK